MKVCKFYYFQSNSNNDLKINILFLKTAKSVFLCVIKKYSYYDIKKRNSLDKIKNQYGLQFYNAIIELLKKY